MNKYFRESKRKDNNKNYINNNEKQNISFQEQNNIPFINESYNNNDNININNSFSVNSINEIYQQIPQQLKRNNSQILPIQQLPISEENLILSDFNFKDVEEEEEDEEEEETILKKNEKKINDKELIKYKCSLDEHLEIEAFNYCQECKIYMCNKCEKIHSGLLKNHHLYNLNKKINEIFTGICTEKNHSMNLEYYCKTHNKLVCAACISKIKSKGNGKHKNCKIFGISKIKNKKKNILEKNIKNLEELSKKLEPSINELKLIFEKINEKKEKLRIEIQKLFTKLRNELNDREDMLLLEVDKKFDEKFFNEKLIKESEKMPNIVKISLEKGKINENEWDDETKLNKLINICIIIENNIKDINLIYEKINIYNSNKEIEFELKPKEEEINKMLMKIKSYGKITIIDSQTKAFSQKPTIEINQNQIMPLNQNKNQQMSFNKNLNYQRQNNQYQNPQITLCKNNQNYQQMPFNKKISNNYNEKK